jgi:hypothetical protein
MRRQNPPGGILKQPANGKPHQVRARKARQSRKLDKLAPVLLGQSKLKARGGRHAHMRRHFAAATHALGAV